MCAASHYVGVELDGRLRFLQAERETPPVSGESFLATCYHGRANARAMTDRWAEAQGDWEQVHRFPYATSGQPPTRPTELYQGQPHRS